MTPKEKAKELVKKYQFVKIANYTSMFEVKECALIAVDEIINELIELSNGEFTFIHKVEYWNEVKHEIEKL